MKLGCSGESRATTEEKKKKIQKQQWHQFVFRMTSCAPKGITGQTGTPLRLKTLSWAFSLRCIIFHYQTPAIQLVPILQALQCHCESKRCLLCTSCNSACSFDYACLIFTMSCLKSALYSLYLLQKWDDKDLKQMQIKSFGDRKQHWLLMSTCRNVLGPRHWSPHWHTKKEKQKAKLCSPFVRNPFMPTTLSWRNYLSKSNWFS